MATATATATATTRPARPAGETLRNVDWATYCKLRDDPANDHLRMTYLDGELTIVSGRVPRGIDSWGLMLVVQSVAKAHRIRFRCVGVTMLGEAFYLGDDVAKIRDKAALDLSIDPPPNLALKVDHARDSESSLPAYARIGVPEVWRFDAVDRTPWFGRLAGDHYEEVGRSLCLPRLTPSLILDALEARTHQPDDSDGVDWLDAWARTLPEPD